MSQALTDVAEKVPDTDKIAKILASVSQKYGSFITPWDSCEDNRQTFENLTRLLKEELRFTNEDTLSSAFAAVGNNSNADY